MFRPRFQFRLPSLTQKVGPRTTIAVGLLVGAAAWLVVSWGDTDTLSNWWQAIPVALFSGLVLSIGDKIGRPSFWSALIPRQFRLRSLFIVTALVGWGIVAGPYWVQRILDDWRDTRRAEERAEQAEKERRLNAILVELILEEHGMLGIRPVIGTNRRPEPTQR